ncbi:MAG: hypothetical protein P8X82_01525, partial [Gemmatimonadales bacterium]
WSYSQRTVGVGGQDGHQDLGVREGLIESVGRRKTELVSVSDYNDEAVKLNTRHLGTARPYFESIGVPVDRSYGRDHTQLIQEIHRTNVTGVNNVVDLTEDFEHFRAQHPVRVGNDSQTHFP